MLDGKPLVVDFYCGLGGWTDGFLTEGYGAIGFDIERHDYGTGGYPGQLVLQDVCTVHGAQLIDADALVASSPCQEFSYRAMPWKRAKALVPSELPAWWSKPESKMDADELYDWTIWKNENPSPPPVLGINLFWQAFRIQQEIFESCGRWVPLVAENVKGAQPWIGKAKANYGNFYLWGDVDSVGGRIVAGRLRFGDTLRAARRGGKKNPDGTENGQGSWFKIADSENRGNGQKVPGFNFHEHEKTGKPGGSFQSAAVNGVKNNGGSWFGIGSPGQVETSQNPVNGVKVPSENGRRTDIGKGARFTTRDCGVEGTKYPISGHAWFRESHGEFSSESPARKAASAAIAKIPLPLSRFIARTYKP